MKSNRDLYLFVSDLAKQRGDSKLSLRSYLMNLRALGRLRRDQTKLTIDEFAAILEGAFTAEAIAETSIQESPAFPEWELRVSYQIQDLAEMEANGSLYEEQRYFGVTAPRGACWYNFEPADYLEAGVTGTFGGWEEGDDSGRVYVPGEVAVIDENGALTTADPREIEASTVGLPVVSWETFTDFLVDGFSYE